MTDGPFSDMTVISKRHLWRCCMTVVEEKPARKVSGYKILALAIAGLAVSVALVVAGGVFLEDFNPLVRGAGAAMLAVGAVLAVAATLLFPGLRTVRPNEAWVLSLFGSYYGTLRDEGFWWVHPFCAANWGLGKDESFVAAAKEKGKETQAVPRRTVSLRVQTFVNAVQKVNDKKGNPVMIGSVVMWRITNPTKAVFAVDDYRMYLSNQADSIIRNVARLYPYDSFSDDDEDNGSEMTLRGSSKEIGALMRDDLQQRVEIAGIEVLEVRINQLSYAEEIASSMLQRQQAEAVLAARKKIVEGAVSMVRMALTRLDEEGVCQFDEDKKAQMVSNLLVVLCGNKDAQPVLNSSTIY